MEFKNTHIDHVIPEVLLKDTEKLNDILNTYDLGGDFDLNDFENWAPLHPSCNTKKNAAVYKGLGIIKSILDQCQRHKPKAREIKIKLDREPKKSEILTRITNALEKEVINHEELQAFLLEHDIEDVTKESNKEFDELISYGILNVLDKTRWKIAKVLNDDEVLVTDGQRTGIAPSAKSPHISWLCGNCLSFGPWDGNRCLICGHMSTPD